MTKRRERQEIAEVGDVEKKAREGDLDDDGGEREDVVGDDAGGEHVGGGDGSDVKAAEDALLTEGDEGGAEPPEAAHHGERNYGAEKKANLHGVALCEDAGVEEEKSEGHDYAEEEEHFVAQGEANAHRGECEEVLQSRSLLPVSSMKTSSRDGVAILRLTSSLPCASRCFTRETMACGGRWVCSA